LGHQIKDDEIGGTCRTHGKIRNAYIIFVGKSEGNRPIGRPKHRWEDNIRRDLREIGWEDTDSIHLAQDRDQ
jgi:hypothetical protein